MIKKFEDFDYDGNDSEILTKLGMYIDSHLEGVFMQGFKNGWNADRIKKTFISSVKENPSNFDFVRKGRALEFEDGEIFQAVEDYIDNNINFYKTFEKVDIEKRIIDDRDNEIYYFNLTMGDIRQIIKLITSDTINIESDNYDRTQITLEVFKANPSPYNDFEDDEYINIRVPLKTGEGWSPSFEIKIYEDGFVAYDNGSGVKMRYPKPLEVYEIISKKLKK